MDALRLRLLNHSLARPSSRFICKSRCFVQDSTLIPTPPRSIIPSNWKNIHKKNRPQPVPLYFYFAFPQFPSVGFVTGMSLFPSGPDFFRFGRIIGINNYLVAGETIIGRLILLAIIAVNAFHCFFMTPKSILGTQIRFGLSLQYRLR